MKSIGLILLHATASATVFFLAVACIGVWRTVAGDEYVSISEDYFWHVVFVTIILFSLYLWLVLKMWFTPAIMFGNAVFCFLLLISMLMSMYVPESVWYYAAVVLMLMAGVIIYLLQKQRDNESFQAFFKPRKAA